VTNLRENILVILAVLVLFIFGVDVVSIKSNLERAVDNSIGNSYVPGALFNVVHAPFIVVVEESVSVTVLNVQEKDIPKIVGCILEILVRNSPDSLVVKIVTNFMNFLQFVVHPASETSFIENLLSWVVIPSLDNAVDHSLLSFSNELMVGKHLRFISIWAGSVKSLPVMMEWAMHVSGCSTSEGGSCESEFHT
jgi:hypothetical protein